MQYIHIKDYTVEDLYYLEQLLDGWYWYSVRLRTGLTKICIQSNMPARLITMIRLKFADRID
jgi:hypothetical protein